MRPARTLLRSAGLVAGLLVARDARADAEADALACAQGLARDAGDAGWSVRSVRAATLALGERSAAVVTTLPGRTYRLLGCAIGAVADLDLVVFDADGKIVQADTTTDAQPTLELTAPPGTYTIVAYARRATGTGAGGAAVALVHR